MDDYTKLILLCLPFIVAIYFMSRDRLSERRKQKISNTNKCDSFKQSPEKLEEPVSAATADPLFSQQITEVSEETLLPDKETFKHYEPLKIIPKQCPHCQALIPEESRFCSNCGIRMENIQTPISSPINANTNLESPISGKESMLLNPRVLGNTFNIFTNEFKKFLLPAAICLILSVLAMLLTNWYFYGEFTLAPASTYLNIHSDPVVTSGYIMAIILMLLGSMIIGNLYILLNQYIDHNQLISYSKLLNSAVKKLPKVLGILLISLLIGVLIALLAFLVCIILILPLLLIIKSRSAYINAASVVYCISLFLIAIPILVRLSLCVTTAIVEDIPVTSCFSRSWNLTRHVFWKVLGYYLLIALINLLAVLLLLLVELFLTFILGDEAFFTNFMTFINQFLTCLFAVVYSILNYQIYRWRTNTPKNSDVISSSIKVNPVDIQPPQ